MLLTPKWGISEKRRVRFGIAVGRTRGRFNIAVIIGQWRFYLPQSPWYSKGFDKPLERWICRIPLDSKI